MVTIKGYSVHAAYSGAEALDILESQTVDIMLTDVRMPEMNGVELYLESRRTHPDLPTFLMTAYATDNIIQEGLAEGIKTVLAKLLDIDILLALFSSVVSNQIRWQ